MNVVVAVAGARVAAWHGWCIAALRAQPSVTVRVVRVEGRPYRAPRGLAARLIGCALAPVDVALDAGGVEGAEVLVDLSGASAGCSAPYGVWSFRLGDDGDADFPFAREIAAGELTFDVALLRRRAGADDVLRTGRFAVTRWYPSTVRIALSEAARWPATFAAAIAAGSEPAGVAGTSPPPPRRTEFERVRFGYALAARLAGAASTAMLDVDEWNVGFVKGGPRRLLAPEPLEVEWLPRPEPLTYIADPFVAERDGVRALFVESFDYEGERGTIDALVLDDEYRVVRRSRVIDIPTHLSYPYPVEIDGELYLVPENSAGNEVALYRCVEFPDRWEREAALFPAFDGIDTTLFAHEGRWWAFCTRYSRGSTLALHAFHAESPRGPWSPHALNPIVVDVASARPAGQPFVVDGALYRPAQDCSVSYGGGLAIARIDRLDPTAYSETVVRRHDAKAFGRWNAGIHTVSFTRDRVVIDGKHVSRQPRRLLAFGRKMRSIVRRLRASRALTRPTYA